MKVDSGHIEEVNWEEGTMTVEFKDGSVYQYWNVPEGVYTDFLGAFSKSDFFRNNVKGKFDYSRG